jgi:hypothetical protein
MPEPEQQPKARPARDPQALTSEYHKARKQLMLWAGILFIWELVGIDLEKAKEAGGNAGAILTAIKSPQAIPWVLVVLVAYFVFKLGIEWSQCEVRRRETLASRVDVGSAWVVAFLACALYAYQAVSRIQVADAVQTSNKFSSIMAGMLIGMSLIMTLFLRFRERRFKPSKWMYAYSLGIGALGLIGLFVFARRGISMKYLIGAIVVAIVVTSLLLFLHQQRAGNDLRPKDA